MAATVYIKDVKIETGSNATVFSTSTNPVKKIYYAVGTYDDVNGLLSNVSPVAAPVAFSDENAATLDLSNITYDANATHWVIYRSAEVEPYASAEFAKQDLGEIERIPISNTSYVDNFSQFAYDEQPSPAYGMLAVTDPETEAALYFNKYTAPPTNIKAIGHFKGHLWTITSSDPRSLGYSLQGYPEYHPSIYKISSFPLDDNDTLITGRVIADLLVLFAKDAVITLSDFPKVQFGTLNAGRTAVLAGAPGCVGVRGVATVEVNGTPYVAWVSQFGVYVTNGSTYQRISTDLDWDTEVSGANLSSASLNWDEKNQILWFQFDSSGGGTNDKEMAFHLDPAHRKASGLPKLSQPTTKATNCMVSGTSGGTHYRYSGHVSDGVVYVEESGNTDAATGSNVALTAKTGRVYIGENLVAVNRCSIRTTDAGAGRTCTVNATTGIDSTGNTQEVSKTIDLSGQKSRVMLVGRAGEWFEFEVVDTGAGQFGILDIRAEVRGTDFAGKVDV